MLFLWCRILGAAGRQLERHDMWVPISSLIAVALFIFLMKVLPWRRPITPYAVSRPHVDTEQLGLARKVRFGSFLGTSGPSSMEMIDEISRQDPFSFSPTSQLISVHRHQVPITPFGVSDDN